MDGWYSTCCPYLPMRLDIRDPGKCFGRGALASRALAVLLTTAMMALALPGVARAQPPGEIHVLPPVAVAPAEKSPETALTLAVVGTGASWAALYYGARQDSGALAGAGLAGILIAPSLGHFYAGETGSGLLHTGIRAGAGAAVFVGLGWLLADTLSASISGEAPSSAHAAPLLVAGGALLSLGSTIYSLYDAPRAARRHNAKARRILIMPAPVVGPDRSTGFGLQLESRF